MKQDDSLTFSPPLCNIWHIVENNQYGNNKGRELLSVLKAKKIQGIKKINQKNNKKENKVTKALFQSL